MPSVMLDNAPVTPRTDARTIGDILGALQEIPHMRHRMITSVACDGATMQGDALTDLLSRSIDSVNELTLESEEQRTLILSILRQSSAGLSQARELRFEIADQLSSGRTADAMKGLAAFVGVWGQTYSAIMQCAATLGLDLDTMEINQQPVATHIMAVAAALRDLKQSLTDHDHVRLADQLAYELGPALDACIDVLALLIQQAEEQPG